MSENIEIWKRLASNVVADCRVFRVREDVSENGNKKSNFFVIESPNWVNVIAVTKSSEVVLIEQFRHGIEEITLEIPGGLIDGAESPEEAARRELLEETGFSSDRVVFLGKSRPNPAIQNNWIYHFAALDAEKTEEVRFDEHESLATKVVPLEQIDKLISEGKIIHSLVVAAFYHFRSGEL